MSLTSPQAQPQPLSPSVAGQFVTQKYSGDKMNLSQLGVFPTQPQGFGSIQVTLSIEYSYHLAN